MKRGQFPGYSPPTGVGRFDGVPRRAVGDVQALADLVDGGALRPVETFDLLPGLLRDGRAGVTTTSSLSGSLVPLDGARDGWNCRKFLGVT